MLEDEKLGVVEEEDDDEEVLEETVEVFMEEKEGLDLLQDELVGGAVEVLEDERLVVVEKEDDEEEVLENMVGGLQR